MNISELLYILPEISLLILACIILVGSAYVNEKQQCILYQLTLSGLALSALLAFTTINDKSNYLLHQMVIHDPLSGFMKLLLPMISAVVLIYSKKYLQDRNIFKGEYLVLVITAVLGMITMSSAAHMVTIYLGLELLSLSLYGMVAFQRDRLSSSEAAMKYFVLGALASGLLLYGISMIYGATGSLRLEQISTAISVNQDHQLLVFGLVFIVTGIAFKLGAVPFHVWMPDVYQGAPTSVTLFISTAPKLAAFAMLFRLLEDGLGNLHADWQGMLTFIAVLSIGFGNVVAISQTNLKRMLAYSAIAHVGFLLLGVLPGTNEAYASALFYIVAYSIMSLAGFGIILLLTRTGFEADQLTDLKGLHHESPWHAFLMLIVMLSMAGVPPLLGFWAKMSVLMSVVNAGFIWLAIFAVFFSVIGAYYYLRIIKLMYFDAPEKSFSIETNQEMQVVLSINALLILLAGLLPQQLIVLCQQIMRV